MVRHTNKRKNKKQTRRGVNRKTRQLRKTKQLRKTRKYRNKRKQRGGYNKNKNGNISYFSLDKRYRPIGSMFDTVKFKANSLLNNIQGNYKPVNPNVSSQPIAKPLSVKDLKLGAGSSSDAKRIFKEANLQASTYA